MSRHLLRPKTKRLIHARARTAVPWQHNGTWTIAGVHLVNTPALGSELFVNGAFAADTNWTKGSGWTISGGQGVATAVAAGVGITQDTVMTAGTWYQQVFDIVTLSAFGLSAYNGSATANPSSTTTGTKTYGFRALGAAAGIFTRSGTVTATIDNASLKAITLNTLFAVRAGVSLPASVAAAGTINPGTQAGVVYGLDSIATPTNMILATHDGGTGILLMKMVAGVWTTLINTTATYAAGFLPQIKWISANTFALYYKGVQIGTNQSVSDAGTGTLHGAFSTSPLNAITGVFVS